MVLMYCTSDGPWWSPLGRNQGISRYTSICNNKYIYIYFSYHIISKTLPLPFNNLLDKSEKQMNPQSPFISFSTTRGRTCLVLASICFCMFSYQVSTIHFQVVGALT